MKTEDFEKAYEDAIRSALKGNASLTLQDLSDRIEYSDKSRSFSENLLNQLAKILDKMAKSGKINKIFSNGKIKFQKR